MRIPVILTVLLGLVVLAPAQNTIKLTMPNSGHRMVWVSEKAPDGEPVDSLSFDGTEFELKASSTGPETKIWILDETTNNIATKKLTDIGTAWVVKPEDFTLLGRAVIRVEHQGDPVESASINLTDGDRKIDQILDSSSKGQIVVYGLKPGSLKVSVSYRSEGKTMDPLKQTSEVGLKRSKPEITILVAIADPVQTIVTPTAGGSKAPGSAEKEPQKQEKESPIGKVIIFLLVFGGAAAAIYFGLKWMKNNPTLVQSKLDQMGVQTPKGDDQSMDTVASVQSPTPLVPPPPQKIMLDDSDPSMGSPLSPLSSSDPNPLPSPMPGPSGAAPIYDPRLVGDAGQLFTITDGTLSVGREGAHAVLLPGESTVSRNHAEIICNGQRVSVKDTGSTNGTFVNGVQVHDEIELKPGDAVQFGSVRFRFEV